MPTVFATNTKALCHMLMQGWSPDAPLGSKIDQCTIASHESVVFECRNDILGTSYNVTILDTKTLIAQKDEPLVTAYFLCLPPYYTPDQDELRKYSRVTLSFANSLKRSVRSSVDLNASNFNASVEYFAEIVNKFSDNLKTFETSLSSNIATSSDPNQSNTSRRRTLSIQNFTKNSLEEELDKTGMSENEGVSSDDGSSDDGSFDSSSSDDGSADSNSMLENIRLSSVLKDINVVEKLKDYGNLQNLKRLYSIAIQIINKYPKFDTNGQLSKLQNKLDASDFLLNKELLSPEEAVGLYETYTEIADLPMFEIKINSLLEPDSDSEDDADSVPPESLTAALIKPAPMLPGSLAPAPELPSLPSTTGNRDLLASITGFNPDTLKPTGKTPASATTSRAPQDEDETKDEGAPELPSLPSTTGNRDLLASITGFNQKTLKPTGNAPASATMLRAPASASASDENPLLKAIRKKIDERGDINTINPRARRKSTMYHIPAMRGTSEEKAKINYIMSIAKSEGEDETKDKDVTEDNIAQTKNDIIELHHELIQRNFIRFFDARHRTQANELLKTVQRLASVLQTYYDNNGSNNEDISKKIKQLLVQLDSAQRRAVIDSGSDSEDEDWQTFLRPNMKFMHLYDAFKF